MVTKEIIFQHDGDMQMKAVAVLIQKASSYRSNIWLQAEERRANGKSLLGVMSLAIQKGTKVEISAEGPDEDDALEAIAGYLENPEV